MDFFGIGPLELLLILILALVVFGPEKLPAMGRQLGKGIRELRKSVTEVVKDISIDQKHDAEVEQQNKPHSQS